MGLYQHLNPRTLQPEGPETITHRCGHVTEYGVPVCSECCVCPDCSGADSDGHEACKQCETRFDDWPQRMAS